MAGPWELRVYQDQQLAYAANFTGPLELGRQVRGEEGPYNRRPDAGRERVVIARLEEGDVSRKHALLEALPDGQFRLTNLSSTQMIGLESGNRLAPGASCPVSLPAVLTLGRKVVRLRLADEPTHELQHLEQATCAPGSLLAEVPARLEVSAGSAVQLEAIMHWLQRAMAVLQSAANSPAFFAHAAQAVVDLVGLDSGRVLLLDGEEPRTEALSAAPGVTPGLNWRPSRQVLGRVCQERRTFWDAPSRPGPEAASLAGIQAVVAAPILDRTGQVIGVLYGERRERPGTSLPQVSRLEALLVELLATGVAAGLARLEQERVALEARVRFEQYFTTELAQHLEANPDLLRGRDTEISILFGDIRGFSRISERLGPARTVEWIRDVMEAMSACVLAHDGVLVDYIGDELMAMWGAPAEQPEHPALACRAALDMLAQLPELNTRWMPVLGEALGFTIGLNTGLARVGDTGTRRKMKYSPLGNTVNVASRVQGATKYFKANVLITEATHARLGADFERRRLGKVRVVNIAAPVEVYQVARSGQAGWSERLRHDYEAALAEFEKRDFRAATSILARLLPEYPDDEPVALLLSRALAARQEPPDFDPVWTLAGK